MLEQHTERQKLLRIFYFISFAMLPRFKKTRINYRNIFVVKIFKKAQTTHFPFEVIQLWNLFYLYCYIVTVLVKHQIF